jgi:hypothetical protein
VMVVVPATELRPACRRHGGDFGRQLRHGRDPARRARWFEESTQHAGRMAQRRKLPQCRWPGRPCKARRARVPELRAACSFPPR